MVYTSLYLVILKKVQEIQWLMWKNHLANNTRPTNFCTYLCKCQKSTNSIYSLMSERYNLMSD